MKIAFWRRWAAQKPVHEFPNDQPLVAQPTDEKKPQARALQQNAAPIAKDERGKIAGQLKRVDVALDGYEDIFSDFDPSPFSSRILSKDLIDEVMRRHRETKTGDVEVRFTVPVKLRNREDEVIIRERLRDYFQAQARKIDEELRGRKKAGTVLMIAGLVLVTLHKVMAELFSDTLVYSIYRWVENPVELFGWIATWVGADKVFLQNYEDLVERRAAFERFGKANFVFINAETVKKGVEAAGKPAEKKEEKPKKSAEPAAPGVAAAEAASATPAAAGAPREPSG